MKRAQLRRKLSKGKPKRKGLPRGNLAENTRGNLKPGKHGVMGPREKGLILMGGVGSKGPGIQYAMPVVGGKRPPYEYNVRPGFEEAALPLEGPPGSEWWNDPKYKGRR